MNKQQGSVDYDIIYNQLIKDFSLTDKQIAHYKRYVALLIEWNNKFNLTAIVDPVKIIRYHFYDSINIAHYIDFLSVSTIVDIGTGAGFPGLPLKILYPHLKVILIEVNNKKRQFLHHLVEEFGLMQVTIIADDWRTFLRNSSEPVDYFFARASLQPEELVRIFKPSSPYNTATCVYWASEQWVPQKREVPFVKKEVHYTIDGVQRKYVFFQKHDNC